MRLLGINIHPVKSTAIRPLTTAQVLPRGLADDRSWMVVDADGVLVSARELHSLFTCVADTPTTDPDLDAALRLRAPGMDDLLVATPTDAEQVPISMFHNALSGISAGPTADAWLRAALGRDDLRLLWCDDPTRRRLNPEHSAPGDHTAFADGYPVTVATLASLHRLNDLIAEAALERGDEPAAPLPIERFRANLVVDGDEPFAEDGWRRLRVGAVELELAKPTGRCVMTTIDPATLSGGKEPIRTLARHRRSGSTTLFAVSMIPRVLGTVTLGDEVEVLERA